MAGDYEQERRERGRRTFAEVNGFDAPEPDLPLTELTVDHVFGEIWTRPGLTRKERRWIALTSVAAAGAVEPMKFHVGGALRSGDITIDELREFVAHLAVYQGYPKAATLQLVVEEVWSGAQA
jgi:4-carboxymuconolactone decarboxylase